MDAATVEKLTREYLRCARDDWNRLDIEDSDLNEQLDQPTLGESFVLLKAEETREEKKSEKEDLQTADIEFSSVLNREKHIILLGEPGSGKSTMMKFFGLCFAGERWAEKHVNIKDKKQHIPVLVPLQTYPRDGYDTLPKAAITEIEKLLGKDAASLYEKWIRENSPYQLVFLFDGFDEIKSNKSAVKCELEKFAKTKIGKKSRIIISSRITGFSKFSEPFKEFTITPLRNDNEKNKYLAQWLAAFKNEQPKEEAVNLLHKLHSERALRKFLDNPLNLQMVAKIYHNSKTIPSNRADIYKKYKERILEQREFTRDNNTLQKIDIALQSIAWHFHNNGKRDKISLLYALERYGKFKEDDKEIIFPLVHDKLNFIGGKNDELRFFHPTIQDYFVSERLKKAWQNNPKATWGYIKPRLHLPSWKEPLSLLVAGIDEKHRVGLIAKVKTAKSSYENRLHRDYFLAAKYIGENGLGETSLANSYLNSASSRLSPKRRLAIASLGYIGGKLAVNNIFTAYRNEKLWDVASDAVIKLDEISFFEFLETLRTHNSIWALTWNIIFRLGEIGSSAAADVLTEVIINHPDSMTRWQAVRALGEIHSAEKIPIIVQALNALIDDEIGDVIDVLAPETFAKFSDKESNKAFCEVLKDNSTIKVYPSIRGLIIKRLGEIGDKDAVPLLTMIMRDDPDIGIRRFAAEALGLIDDNRIAQNSVTKLREVLYLENSQFSNDDQIFLGRAKIKALEKLSSHLDTSILLEQARSDDDSRMREVAFKALGDLGDKSVVPDLIEIIRNDYSRSGILVYEEAVVALGKIKDNRAVDCLLEMLSLSKETWHGQEIIQALGEIGDEKAVQPLITIANNKNITGYMRWEAIEALGKIGGSEAINASIHLINADDDQNIVISAIDALGQIAVPQTVDVLISLLQHKDQSVGFIGKEKIIFSSHYQSHAAEALGKIGDPKAIPYLITALTYHYPDTSLNSAVALGEIFNKQPDPEKVKAEALPALLDVIKKADENFNWGALQFLGPIGDERAIPILIKLVGKEYWHGWWARNMLEQIGGLESIPALMKANAQKEVISILQRWHSRLNNTVNKERDKNLKTIRTITWTIETLLIVNKFMALFAKVILKFKRNPSWRYERWRYYTQTDEVDLLTTLAEITDDVRAPRFEPMQPPPRPLWQWALLAGSVFAISGILGRMFDNSHSLLFTGLISVLIAFLSGFGGWILERLLDERMKNKVI